MLNYPDRTFCREAIRRVDEQAIQRFGIPGIVLMENAARGIADHADRLLGAAGRRVLILCGGGNNGGDGLAAARHLHNRGLDCTIILTRPPDGYRGDAATNLAICQAMKLNLVEAADDPLAAVRETALAGGAGGAADVVIDALMGTGLSQPLRSPLRELVGWLNTQSAPVLAVDIPTGLDCDTGEPLGEEADAVRATLTATMVGRKRGFDRPAARPYTGDVYVVDIGAPRELILELGDPPPQQQRQ